MLNYENNPLTKLILPEKEEFIDIKEYMDIEMEIYEKANLEEDLESYTEHCSFV
jgi:hypothetical protein